MTRKDLIKLFELLSSSKQVTVFTKTGKLRGTRVGKVDKRSSSTSFLITVGRLNYREKKFVKQQVKTFGKLKTSFKVWK